jgi:hypothetical protein
MNMWHTLSVSYSVIHNRRCWIGISGIGIVRKKKIPTARQGIKPEQSGSLPINFKLQLYIPL